MVNKKSSFIPDRCKATFLLYRHIRLTQFAKKVCKTYMLNTICKKACGNCKFAWNNVNYLCTLQNEIRVII